MYHVILRERPGGPFLVYRRPPLPKYPHQRWTPIPRNQRSIAIGTRHGSRYEDAVASNLCKIEGKTCEQGTLHS